MWPNPQFPADLVAFTKEIINGKFHFLCIVIFQSEKNLPSENLSRGNVPFSIYIPGHTDQKKLRKNCPYSEFFWSVFSRVRTECKDLRSKSPYRVRIQENTDQKNSEYEHFLCSENMSDISSFFQMWYHWLNILAY